MRSMHYAVDQLDLDTIFPEVQAIGANIPSSPDVQKCLDVVKDSVLNRFQLQSITSMLDSKCLMVGHWCVCVCCLAGFQRRVGVVLD